MPRVRYLGGGGYYIRDGPDFEDDGDEADVSERTADRLTARGDFELVDNGGGGDDVPAPLGADASEMIDAGECPWCSDYEGENVGMHASRAHPDEWDTYQEARS